VRAVGVVVHTTIRIGDPAAASHHGHEVHARDKDLLDDLGRGSPWRTTLLTVSPAAWKVNSCAPTRLSLAW